MNKKYFGTDGVRGYVGKDLTEELAFQLGAAYGLVLTNEKKPINSRFKILIGMDTRISCSLLQDQLLNALSIYDIDVVLLGVIPTPGVSYLTTYLEADGAIMISASHNPYHDNGIKFFQSNGTKISDEMELHIEHHMDNSFDVTSKNSSVSSLSEGKELYTEFLVSKFQHKFVNQNKKIVIDCANGATYETAKMVFDHFDFETIFMFNEPDGININVNCGSTHTDNLKKAVLSNKADFGIAYDGDGDRIAVVDNKGNEINGDELLYLFARFLKESKSMSSTKIAATIVSNIGLELSLQKIGLSVEKTNVGDKYIMEALRDNHLDFGGESSGHIIFFNEHVTGDGTLASLFFCWLIDFYGNEFNQIRNDFTMIPQYTNNLRVKDKYSWKTNSFILEVIDGIEKELLGTGRLLIRPSGTEPIVRIMVEHPNAQLAKGYVDQLSMLLEKEYGNSPVHKQ